METLARTETRIPVTAVIARRVRPGAEAAFEEWQRGITAEAARFPGFGGITIIRPADAARPEYLVVLQYDHPDHLHHWMMSPERAEWMKRSEPFVESAGVVHEMTGLEHWFTLPGRATPRPAPRHKMWLLSWLTGYLVAAAITTGLMPWLSRLPRLLGLLVITFLMTGLMTYVFMPRITRLFWPWLYP